MKTLQTTNSLMVLSLLFFYCKPDKNIHEILLSGCLIIQIIFAQWFWCNPIQHSIIHRIDACLAKITISYSIIYTAYIKSLSYFSLTSYIAVLGIMSFHFYNSHIYSSKSWCCENHIYYHGLAHIFAFVASIYTFI
jgi:hypothetical protein